MKANYFSTKAMKELVISKTGTRFEEGVKVFTVKGKVEARKIAAANNAICWNF